MEVMSKREEIYTLVSVNKSDKLGSFEKNQFL